MTLNADAYFASPWKEKIVICYSYEEKKKIFLLFRRARVLTFRFSTRYSRMFFFLVNTRDLSTINFSEITLMFKILRLKWQVVWCVTNLILPQAVHKTKSLYFFLVSLYLIFKKLQRSKNHDVSPLKLCFVISPIHNNCHKTHYQSIVLNTHC